MSETLIKLLLTKTSPVVAKIYSMKAGPEEVEEEDPDPKKKARKTPPKKGIWAKFSV